MFPSSLDYSTYLSPPSVSQPSPQMPLSKLFFFFLFFVHPRDTLTRNGLRCFPAPVNRLPACEGIDGFDIRCCLTQKRRRGPRDGPFLTLHIHHAGQSNERDTGLPQGRGEQRGKRRRKSEGEEGVSFFAPVNVGGGNNRPAYHISPLKVFNF